MIMPSLSANSNQISAPNIATDALPQSLRRAMLAADNWLSFDAFMAQALYAPGWGYYANASAKFGHLPSSGSDFVTAPELSPFFGQALARQVAQALQATDTTDVWEFGAGSGALAEQVLQALDAAAAPLENNAQKTPPRATPTASPSTRQVRYHIVELSASLRERQAARLARFGQRVQWHEAWPTAIKGVVLGNEVLDAMPVKLLSRQAGQWHERGVTLGADGQLAWQDRATALSPPFEMRPDSGDGPDVVTEIHPQAEAFVRSLGERLERGAAFFIDYGFSEAEYYHPQRHMGTLMCHRAHQSDDEPLRDVGQKDITAHVNFTGIALAAQDAGMGVLGYTSQGRFLLNCKLLDLLENASLAERSMAQKLVTEHEMGELFKVLGLVAAGSEGEFSDAMGFSVGDRSHRL
jgi:SAM-dependent MidA family methyltransferase